MSKVTQALPRILCVDDEPQLLKGLERTLGLDYDVVTATGGAEALLILEQDAPFAVTISDMRMPEMDGAAYLEQAARVAPNTVRMLLTGYSQLDAAVRAINEGGIFRFLTKPCEGDALERAVRDALAQHRLILAEKELLEETLIGSIRALTEVLSLVNPIAFNHGRYVTELASRVAELLQLRDVWQIEAAVMLGHLGYAGMPQSLVERAFRGQPLSGKEKKQVQGAPHTAHGLLEGIPRLDGVLQIVERLATPPLPPSGDPSSPGDEAQIAWGVHVIQTCEAAVGFYTMTANTKETVAALRQSKSFAEPVAAALEKVRFPRALRTEVAKGEPVSKPREVTANQLEIGMRLEADARSPEGVLFMKAGQDVTDSVIRVLRRMAARDNLVQPLVVSSCP